MKDRRRQKRKLGSFPFLSVIFSITLSLVVMGIFGIAFIYLKTLTSIVQSNVEVQVYLDKSTRDHDVKRLQKIMTTRPYIRSEDTMESIKFISKETAAEVFVRDTGEDFTKFLGDNPLRDAFSLRIINQYQSVDSLKYIEKDLSRLSGVYEVVFQESLIASINKNLRKIGVLFLGMTLILLVAVIVLINNTIRIALFSQRFLIRSMQLVGATKRFIRWPFLKRSLIYGLISGILASGIIFGIIQIAQYQIEDLNKLYDQEPLFILFSALIFLGLLISYLSTLSSMRRYFKISLDELY
ncbi:ABC transporter permease [Cyclobacteriaceae bacterium]|jgi:cell division transport system permease protein|nr:ABC transporter permease [Cyclobacteriaceae bacterium]MDC1516229.1 ABC transporter permease [Cyclobacteriaceae bacterium]|tara:strand:- start:31 stop:921 length:891 start_codon:yes stop_codon:yes gene_type:complete